MKEHGTRVRARYPETDRMGIVHHTHYLVWFELGRTELLRDLGIPYASLEARSIFMPVVEAGARYLAPVRYDEEVEVLTTLEEITGVKVKFAYRLLKHPGGEAVARGFTVHAAVGSNGSPCRLPQDLRDQLEPLVGGGKEEP